MRFLVAILSLLVLVPGHSASGSDDNPVLVRLVFEGDPQRLRLLEDRFEADLLPLLQQHGLAASQRQGRPTGAGFLTRLFVVDHPARIDSVDLALLGDSTWQVMVGSLPFRLHAYDTPASRGVTRSLGSGRRHGIIQSFGLRDGITHAFLYAIIQDSQHQIWIGGSGGITRYDGGDLVTFTRDSGLINDHVLSLYEDEAGHLWIGTNRGLTRFDGQRFTSYTRADGLAGDQIAAIYPAADGGFWLAGGAFRWERIRPAGLTHYLDGSFTAYSLPDGVIPIVRGLVDDAERGLILGTSDGAYRVGLTPGSSELTVLDTLVNTDINRVMRDHNGSLWFATDSNLVHSVNGSFVPYAGVPRGMGYSMTQTRDGSIWAGGVRGLTRLSPDGTISTLTSQDGLANTQVTSLLEDDDGHLWLTTLSGISRIDEGRFLQITTEEGLPSNGAMDLFVDGHNLWIGTWEGVCRYNERVECIESMAGRHVTDIVGDDVGNLWFRGSGGLHRFDGETLETLNDEDGMGLARDAEGSIWSVTPAGLVRHAPGTPDTISYDAAVMGAAVDADGGLLLAGRTLDRCIDGSCTTVATSSVRFFSVHVDRSGGIWAGTGGQGVLHLSDEGRQVYSKVDGLGGDFVLSISEDTDGRMWFGTFGGGVSVFDGRVFQTLSARDGLPHDAVQDIVQDEAGDMWIATEGGVCRYRPSRRPPGIRLTQIIADRRYGPLPVLQVPSTQHFVGIEFEGLSFDTAPDQFAYLYRLVGRDTTWQLSRANLIEFTELEPGEYRFEVKAVDRDLNYSADPAILRLNVVASPAPYIYGGALLMALIGLAYASVSAAQRRRERDQARNDLMQQMASELETAHDLQMGLMPESAPSVAGMDISGRCVTATQVGGDFYDFTHREGRISLSLADVTGHAMQAAIPGVMFSGILDRQLEITTDLQERFRSLNESLCRNLGAHTFICFAMAEIDEMSRSVQLASCGTPFPLHYRASDGLLRELESSGYPLGVSRDSEYDITLFSLHPGDYLILYSDGIPEAGGEHSEEFGYDRTLDCIRSACNAGSTATEVADQLLAAAHRLAPTEQSDDMTCVVLRLES